MADSNHFDGSVFQGIDDNATVDEASFNAALEGKITNNAYWIHRQGAGTAVKRFIGGPTAIKVEINTTKKSSSEWITIHQQPFVVTKGLYKVRLLLQLTCTGEDLDLKVLFGEEAFGEGLYIVSGTGTAEQQFVVIEFEPTKQFIFDTVVPLIICAKAYTAELPTPMPTTGSLSIDTLGMAVDFTPGIMDTDFEFAFCCFLDNGENFDDPDAPDAKIADPIHKRLGYGFYDQAATAGVGVGVYSYFEITLAYVTVRSLAIRTEYK